MSVRSKSFELSVKPQADLFFPDHDGRGTAYSRMAVDRKTVSAGLVNIKESAPSADKLSMDSNTHYEDKGHFRRQYPRRPMRRKVGVLCEGTYFVCDTGEIGEGGMSISSGLILTEGQQVVVSLQIPSGDFVSLRGIVRSVQPQRPGERAVVHGLSFSEIPFAIKRQIRAFVSARRDIANA